MSVTIQAKTDYTYLFSSLGTNAYNAANSNFLSQYASIKNGSYAKLLKAYYSAEKSSGATTGATDTTSAKSSSSSILEKILEEKRNPKVSKDVKEANANLTTGLSNLKASVSELQSDKIYTDTANGQSAADKVVSAMKNYVSNYNNAVNAAKGSTLTSKTAYVANIMRSTAANADKLSEIGVTVNADGTIELNEAKLKATDVSKVQELFSSEDIMSYGSTVASRLQFAGATTSTSTSNTSANTTASSSAAALKADGKLLASDTLYEKVKDEDGNPTDEYDVDKIFAAAKSFVSNYNSMFDAAESSTNSGVSANLSYIREKTARSEDTLKQFGISVDDKGRMKIDEDTFKKSDMSKVQEFFKDYGSSVATNASLVNYYMTTQANAASGYTATGAYNVQGNANYEGAV